MAKSRIQEAIAGVREFFGQRVEEAARSRSSLLKAACDGQRVQPSEIAKHFESPEEFEQLALIEVERRADSEIFSDLPALQQRADELTKAESDRVERMNREQDQARKRGLSDLETIRADKAHALAGIEKCRQARERLISRAPGRKELIAAVSSGAKSIVDELNFQIAAERRAESYLLTATRALRKIQEQADREAANSLGFGRKGAPSDGTAEELEKAQAEVSGAQLSLATAKRKRAEAQAELNSRNSRIREFEEAAVGSAS